ncbi:MarR family winged helix-turn-helix transcriptional regulator [Lacticaseibacillus brantae]|nr:MarR family transcriptional regulator [Lacticaseibacillus brantae]
MNSGYLIMNLAHQLKYQLNQALLQEDLTVQQWALLQQLMLERPLTAVQLANRLDMDKPTVSGIVKRLVEKDFLTKQANPTDQRSQLLNLTTAGQTAAITGQGISNQILDAIIAPLSTEDQQLLNQLLGKLIPTKEQS